MSKIFKTVTKSFNFFSAKPIVRATVLNFSTVLTFREEDLEKPECALNLENNKEKWTPKYLLQQSR